MSLLIIAPTKDPTPWTIALHQQDPTLAVQVWPHEGDRTQVEFALCWQQPPDIWRNYPNLRCISSLGAGVDHLLGDATLPPDVPVVRLIDPLLAQSMFEYICTAALNHLREFDRYQAQQATATWEPRSPRSISATTIGLMGLGALGCYAAPRLAAVGFNVVGWARSPKHLPGIHSYVGPSELSAFLARSQILVCLLPLTPATEGILNLDLFQQLPPAAYLINPARGAHLVEADLLTALAAGYLSGACLDVFHQEPLPADHPFWPHPALRVTPHCASLTDPASV
ncbi:MAG TPA: glyoxylate/hydroxypyruvate reductase A, partial [Candidatus Obscuribacterales bacterium]